MTEDGGAPVESIPEVDMTLCKYPYQKFDVEKWKAEHLRRMEIVYGKDVLSRFESEFEGEYEQGQAGMFRTRAGFEKQLEAAEEADRTGKYTQPNGNVVEVPEEQKKRGAPWVFAIEFTSWKDQSGERADFFSLYLEGGMK